MFGKGTAMVNVIGKNNIVDDQAQAGSNYLDFSYP